MTLFVCERCLCIENSALCNFWGRRSEGRGLICSECESGRWHGCFDKVECSKEMFEEKKVNFTIFGEVVYPKKEVWEKMR